MKYVLYDLDTGAVIVFTSNKALGIFLKNIRKNQDYEENVNYQLLKVDAVDPIE